MLEKLLNEIKNGNTSSPAKLAERLNLSLAMVNAMLETLKEQGYLKDMIEDCSGDKPCPSCPISSLCGLKSRESAHILVVSEKSR